MLHIEGVSTAPYPQDDAFISLGDQIWTMEDLSTGVEAIHSLSNALKDTPIDKIQLPNTSIGSPCHLPSTPRICTLLLWVGCDILMEEDFKKFGPSGYYFFSLVDSSETELLDLLELHQKHLEEPPKTKEFVGTYVKIKRLCEQREARRYYFADLPTQVDESPFKINGAKTIVMY